MRPLYVTQSHTFDGRTRDQRLWYKTFVREDNPRALASESPSLTDTKPDNNLFVVARYLTFALGTEVHRSSCDPLKCIRYENTNVGKVLLSRVLAGPDFCGRN